MSIALIFDMDGVVVDNFSFHEKAWKLFCSKHGLDFGEAFRSGIFGGTNKDHLEAFFDKSLSPEEIGHYESEKEAIYRNLYASHIKPVAGLHQFLQAIQSQNIPFALATSSPTINVNFVLEKTEMGRYFDIRLDASDIQLGKPHPEIFLKTAAKLNIENERCIVFEDSVNGIYAAQKAGMKVVALTTTHQKHEIPKVDLVISDFRNLRISQLKKLL